MEGVATACELTMTSPRGASIPIASGENEYTRYGYRNLIEREGADQIFSSTIRRSITPLSSQTMPVGIPPATSELKLAAAPNCKRVQHSI